MKFYTLKLPKFVGGMIRMVLSAGKKNK
ncbi:MULTISPECIES: stage V sporulation protein SpoVM [Bacillaceae]|uniref:Stage V sporulation protein M n=3 Tax=Domibacillus TaxID=1433999 RepID=A0A1Q5P4P7_9BACI|nr:stage V sporulation protein M [Domibacillus aminovorans]OAH62129.1 stage V sporulation protein M [Domibacillus aminovorans]OKL37177.1 stage V sporulation protein M [Domibacillus mangrovi]OLN22825.1 stage V sporulation protein M [Domibacillus antri]